MECTIMSGICVMLVCRGRVRWCEKIQVNAVNWNCTKGHIDPTGYFQYMTEYKMDLVSVGLKNLLLDNNSKITP